MWLASGFRLAAAIVSATILTASNASKVARCLRAAATPQALSRSEIKELPVELRSAGFLAAGSDSLAKLEDGTHLYLVFSDGRVAVTPRVPDPRAEGRYLATHRSLVREFAHDSDSVVGAGEFRILGGRVTSLSNRSGTYRGGPMHLAHSEAALRAKGLEVEPGTTRQEFSSGNGADRTHADAARLAEMRREIAANPRWEADYRRTLDTWRRLASLIPGPRPGWIDHSVFLSIGGQLSTRRLDTGDRILDLVNAVGYIEKEDPILAIFNAATKNSETVNSSTIPDALSSVASWVERVHRSKPRGLADEPKSFSWFGSLALVARPEKAMPRLVRLVSMSADRVTWIEGGRLFSAAKEEVESVRFVPMPGVRGRFVDSIESFIRLEDRNFGRLLAFAELPVGRYAWGRATYSFKDGAVLIGESTVVRPGEDGVSIRVFLDSQVDSLLIPDP